MAFELMYGGGGYYGPFASLKNAIEKSVDLLTGSPSERTIYIVPRDGRCLHPNNALLIVKKHKDGSITAYDKLAFQQECC